MAEENEIRKVDITESVNTPEQGLDVTEQQKLDFAKAHPERIPLAETEHNPGLNIPEEQQPIVESGTDEAVVQVPGITEDPFSEAELMGKKKTAEELALEHLIEHGLDMNAVHDKYEEMLDLSQHQE